MLSFKQVVQLRDLGRRNQNYLCKPLSEFETSKSKKISYSYFELPEEFPRPSCLAREDPSTKKFYDSLLNDKYTSLPQGSEKFQFKYKNQHEDNLFKVEDEMYKLDHDIQNYKKTMQVMEEEK